MTPHILACAYQGFGCSSHHISAGLVLVILAGLAVVGGIAGLLESQKDKNGTKGER